MARPRGSQGHGVRPEGPDPKARLSTPLCLLPPPVRATGCGGNFQNTLPLAESQIQGKGGRKDCWSHHTGNWQRRNRVPETPSSLLAQQTPRQELEGRGTGVWATYLKYQLSLNKSRQSSSLAFLDYYKCAPCTVSREGNQTGS